MLSVCGGAGMSGMLESSSGRQAGSPGVWWPKWVRYCLRSVVLAVQGIFAEGRKEVEPL